MSNFTQEEETLIVKNAMELTATILFEENELNITKSQVFESIPLPPERVILPQPSNILPEYPPKPKAKLKYFQYLKETIIKYKFRFLIVAAVLAVALIFTLIKYGFFSLLFSAMVFGPGLCIVILIVTFCLYSGKRSDIERELAQEPEYLQAIEDAKKEAEKKQKESEEQFRLEQEKLDIKYEEEKNHYENVTVPKYNEQLSKWTEKQNTKIAFLEEELRCNTEALNNLYNNAKLISAHYRELWILKWLYEDMSTSDHDIKYATELLDRDRQREETKYAGENTQSAINDMKGVMMTGFNAVYNAIEQGNVLQEQSIEILSKTRRDNNINNLIGTAQRHNTNKMLSTLLEKK